MEDRGTGAAVSIEYSYYFIVPYCRVRSESSAARGGRAEQPGERVPLDGGDHQPRPRLLRRLRDQQLLGHHRRALCHYLQRDLT